MISRLWLPLNFGSASSRQAMPMSVVDLATQRHINVTLGPGGLSEIKTDHDVQPHTSIVINVPSCGMLMFERLLESIKNG